MTGALLYIHGAGVPQSIKITAAMIERGVTELFSYAVDDSRVSAECIAAVDSAMK